jgi:signal transduction histidine kinase
VALDSAAAVIAFVLTLVLLDAHGTGARGLKPVGVVLAAIACLPLLAHRRAPLGVLGLTTAASAALNGLGYPQGPPFGPTLALFFVAADQRTPGRFRQTALVVVGLLTIHVGATTIPNPGFPTVAVLSAIVVWGGAWLVGDQVRQRRERLIDLEERAGRAERESKRERRLAAAEERTRIARDLHDSAAHAINVILVQAGAARLLQDRDPELVRTALNTIEDVARETIGEIDRLIRGLREDGDGAGAGADRTIEPPIGLAGIETLVERHRAAGLPVEIQVDGARRPLAPGLDQAAYRILQESLTNAARHGSGAADVEIAYGEDELRLSVTNPVGRAAAGNGVDDGHGVLGMRERAALLGGTLVVRPIDQRFRVFARLPYAPGEGAPPGYAAAEGAPPGYAAAEGAPPGYAAADGVRPAEQTEDDG